MQSVVSFMVTLYIYFLKVWLVMLALYTSPVKYDKKVLETIGKKLKKNSVALDIVDFGESDDEKPEKLEALIASVNNSDNSHIVHIPPGENALSDVLLR
jgi:26S proteasome regulatory subunit N10